MVIKYNNFLLCSVTNSLEAQIIPTCSETVDAEVFIFKLNSLLAILP